MTTPRNPDSRTMAYALVTACVLFTVLVIGLVILAVTNSLNEQTTPVVINVAGFVGLAIPALIAAAFAERASRDIRNGVLQEKSRQGAAQALTDHGPQVVKDALADAQVMTRTGPVVTAELVALTSILERLTTNAEKTGQPSHVDVQVHTTEPNPPTA